MLSYLHDTKNICRWDGTSRLCLFYYHLSHPTKTDCIVEYLTLRQFMSTPIIILLCRACISNAIPIHIHKCSLTFTDQFALTKLTNVVKQLACIWPHSFSPLSPLIWMPAVFFFLLLFCCHTRRLFLDGQNELDDHVAQQRTQLAALS